MQNNNTNRIRSLLGLECREGHADLALRVQLGDLEPDPSKPVNIPGRFLPRTPSDRLEVELCDQLQINLVYHTTHIQNAHQNTVLRADFRHLRVHHILDLLRLMDIGVNPWKLDGLNAWFPQAVLNTFKGFSSGWEGEHPIAIPDTYIDEPLETTILEEFLGRWGMKDDSGSLYGSRLRALPIVRPCNFISTNIILIKIPARMDLYSVFMSRKHHITPC